MNLFRNVAFLLSIWGQLTSAQELPVHVTHSFGDAPLLSDSLRYKNEVGETISVTRLSYLLSGFEFQTADGSWKQTKPQPVWIDLGKRRTSFVLKYLPKGAIRGIRFKVGLDEKSNAADPAGLPFDHPLNPNLNGLHWSWQGGYIFMAVEGHFRTPGEKELRGYSYHFARNPNQTTITLEIDKPTRSLALNLDLEKILAPIAIGKLGASTHSREGDPIADLIRTKLPEAWTVTETIPIPASQEKIERPRPKYPPGDRELYRFSFDPKFSFPKLPTDNPMTVAGVTLGEKLFNETRLSRDDSISCASCHRSDSGLSDPRQFSLGVDGKQGKRNAMPLFNLAWKESFFWDGRAPSIRAQVLHPIQDPLEMDQSLEDTIAKLKASEEYPDLFEDAFGVPGIDTERLALALEQFLLSKTSYKSKLDLAYRGKTQLTKQEKRGFELFFTEYEPRANQFGADCFHCHGGALFSNHGFANNGLDLTFSDPGLSAHTKRESDLGKFSVPSLRNVAQTAPYMHDGRFNTLEAVIDHYDHGLKRSATLDPNLAKHPKAGLGLSNEDKAALVAFLKTLSEEKPKR